MVNFFLDKKIIKYQNFERKILPTDKQVVLAGGCFDILHYGHLSFLKKAKAVGGFLIIALEPDDSIQLKGRRPFHNQQERAEILAALEMVDLVLLLPVFKNDADYLELVKTIKPQIIAVSEKDINYQKKAKQAQEIGIEIKIVIPLLDKFSSSRLISQL